MNKKIFFLIFITTFILSGCSVLPGVQPEPTPTVEIPLQPNVLIVDGMLVPQSVIEIKSKVIASVEDVVIEEGDIIEGETIMLRLDGWEQQKAAVSSAELALLQAQQDLDDLNRLADLTRLEVEQQLITAQQSVLDAEENYENYDTDEYQQEIDDADVDVSDAEDDLEDARDELVKYKDLDPDNTLRKNAENDVEDAQQALDEAERIHDRLVYDRDAAKTELDLAREKVDELRWQYSQKQVGPDKTDLSLAEAKVKQAQDALEAAKNQLDSFSVKAPFSGEVLHIYIEKGDTVVTNQVLVSFADTTQYFVETTDLTEMDVVNIEIGDSVNMTPDSIPDLVMEGKVSDISPWYYEKGGDVQYVARIELKETDPRLRWGMTIAITFP